LPRPIELNNKINQTFQRAFSCSATLLVIFSRVITTLRYSLMKHNDERPVIQSVTL